MPSILPFKSLIRLQKYQFLRRQGKLLMDKSHVPGNADPDLEAYFLDVAK